MRCVSKCFIGGKSLRFYSLFLFGIVFGFSLSSILQAIGTLDTSSHLKIQEARGHPRERESGPNVGFSNLRKDPLEEDQTNLESFGDYGYEREPEAGMKRVPGGREDRVDAYVSQTPSLSTPLPEEVRVKVREYQRKREMDSGETGQGQSARTEVSQPTKLSEELSQRQTLLVVVITSVTQLMTQTMAIQGTWAPHAKEVLFFVGEVDIMPHLPNGMKVIELEGVDDQMGSWELKEISAVKYLMEHYLEKVQWFILIGDQTYLVTDFLEETLNKLDAEQHGYIGLAEELGTNGKNLLCRKDPGIVYSHALLRDLRPYLPVCWPSGQGDKDFNSLGGCLSVMGAKCTQAKETQELFLSEAKPLVESPSLFSSSELTKAAAIFPVQYPKYMYRLHSYYMEVNYNTSLKRAKVAESTLQSTQPFIPAHLRSPSKLHPTPTTTTAAPTKETTPTPKADGVPGGVVVRPRNVPKNKFEINSWEYFNQTRLMSVMHESPARGIIGGFREEARFSLTKAIYLANQGLPQSQRYVFDKLENGYHRVDPMRGSEFILDFVFRKQSDRNARIKKRLSILRPYHETIIPVDGSEMLPTVNFLVTLSGLSNRLEHFLMQYEKNVLQLGEDATLTIVLFESPDAPKVRLMVQQYLTRYQGAQMTVVDVHGEFARGVGLNHGLGKFDRNQLVFMVDVDLDISTEFLQRCRLNTIQGKQLYFPVFFKLYNQDFVDRYHRGNHTLLISRNRGHWAHYSYGMVCLYASDYLKSGGFDVTMRGWGEEDVDLLNKVLKAGLEVFRAPDPGLVHNWHTKTCNKEKVVNPATYEHCLQSKGENLADRIELAQYVFENELKKGNVL